MFQNQINRGSNKNHQSGFTIIEVMIAVSIFAIGFLAISSLQFSASKNNRTASEITQAVTIAADHMERLVVLSFNHADLDPTLNPHTENQGKYHIQWIVADSDLNLDGVDDAKTVSMTVTWDRLAGTGEGTRLITIDFLKPDA
ncbi:MAG: prepilin-type N-terminal cleavage/methylation domain-containing protein [Desulfobacterales bacterium]|nr:MAG: prepilin-type N-terminal cleavage/methylation domain-containing protein [Desulfobacterales bacterium]